MIEFCKPIEEVWLPACSIGDDLKPYYTVSNYGRVFSTYSNSLIAPQINHNGYLTVGLMLSNGNRVHRKVHRLVMFTFKYFENCENLQVNHINFNKMDNRLWNLEWVTPLQNTLHARNCPYDVQRNKMLHPLPERGVRSTLTDDDIQKIYGLLIDGNLSYEEIGNMFNVTKRTISNIAHGKCWKGALTDEQIKNLYDYAIKFKGTLCNNDKNKICEFYESIPYFSENMNPTDYAKLALQYANIEENRSTISIARRLLLKSQNKEVYQNYNYEYTK